MTEAAALGLKRSLSISFDDAVRAVPEALAREGFGVLTEIDVQATLKKKLGVDMRRYRILGACNPTFADRALKSDADAGVMLPCNVVLYEDDAGRATVVAVDPLQTVAASRPELRAVAGDVRTKLIAVLDALPARA